jgi:hypothetical protein
MGGASYPMNMNNQNYQKYHAEEIRNVAVDIQIVLDKLEMLIQDMVDQCDCEDGCCK